MLVPSEFDTHAMSQLSPNTNGSLVALADDSGHVTVLDPTKDFAVLWKFPNSTEKAICTSAQFSPVQRTLCACTATLVRRTS